MSNEHMTYQDLLQIIELIKSSSQFGEFHLKMGDIEVDLKRCADGLSAAVPASLPAPEPIKAAAAPRPAAHEPAAAAPAAVPAAHQRHGHVGGGEVVVEPTAPLPDKVDAGARGAMPTYPSGAELVKSPMVGTFYCAPEPGARPFVELGQRVEADATVCIIEVMKLMNSIPAGKQGVVTHMLVTDGDPVEYGQVLMVIEPG